MIGGNPKGFINRIYSCQDTVFIYKGIKYWFQDYMPDKNSVHMEIFQSQPPSDNNLWEYNGNSISDGQPAFLDAPIFDGKTFREAESDISWVDY